jgi:hypothetical protein
MDAVTFARQQMESAFTLFNQCADGMTDEQYNFKPGGTSNAAAKTHVHAMSSVDFFVNGMLRGQQLGWSALAASTNLPANPLEVWGYEGAIAQEPIKEYAQKVQAQALEYLGTLGADDLDREIDTRFFGKQTVAWVLQLVITHSLGHAGDIAAIKGLQGLKGLPF